MSPDNTINLAFGLSAAFFATLGIWQVYRLSMLGTGQSLAGIKSCQVRQRSDGKYST